MARQEINNGLWSAIKSALNGNFTELYDIANAGDSGLREFLDPISEGDDKGITCTNGQFTVGSKDDPRETVLGGGDSTPIDTAYHCDTVNTSGTTIISATDVTDILESDSGSSTGFFGGSASGKYLLIGEEHTFGGAKLKWDTVGAIEPDNVVVEYLKDSSTWVQAPFMVTNSDFDYSQYADRMNTNDVEQLFVGFDPDEVPTIWNKTTLNINGVNINKYWARFRIVTDITSDSTIEQIKTHSNSFEIEADGHTSYRGRSRRPKTLLSGLTNTVQNTSANPANENVEYGSGVTAGRTDNEFANGAVDGFLLVQNIEKGLDTSIPLELSVSWYPKGTGVGDVNFHLDLFDVSDDFIYDGAAVPRSIENSITTIPANSNEKRITTKIKFMVNKLDTNSAVVMHLHRDATSGNPLDTLANNVIITNVRLTGYFWK